jgi:AcrR family transcriptional regulator
MARPRPPHRLDEILDAATRVFARSGLERSKMSDVAAEAGVSQGTLYNYVESKEALFRLLLDRGLAAPPPAGDALPLKSPAPEALAQRMDEAIAANYALPRLDEALRRRRVKGAREELAAILRELFERTLATREAADVVERSAADVPELAEVFFRKVRRGVFDRFAELARKRMASGHYRRADPHIVARVLVENIVLFARHIYRDPEPLPFDLAQAPEVVIGILVAGVVAQPGRGRAHPRGA